MDSWELWKQYIHKTLNLSSYCKCDTVESSTVLIMCFQSNLHTAHDRLCLSYLCDGHLCVLLLLLQLLLEELQVVL